ncbi:MAG: FIST C-terminal domain-containing protein [Alphaproteobacteria bacterium]|nr:FIST C-terminal domain-containing protein [Alphaproteobacteria bacterium]
MTESAILDFDVAHAAASDWKVATDALITHLEVPDGANVGFLYATDHHAGHLADIADRLMHATKIDTWTGTVGIGILSTAGESFDEPAIAVMVGTVPEGSVRPFGPVRESTIELDLLHREWIENQHPTLTLVHADPRHPPVAHLIESLAENVPTFLTGGLTSSRHHYEQMASQGRPLALEHGVSGVMFSAWLPIATGLTQGCSPIGPTRTVTEGDENILKELDGRPALDALIQDIGPEYAEDLSKLGGSIYVAFPVPGSDMNDYLVRNMIAIDPEQGWIGVGEEINPGDKVMFCKRDRESAEADLRRMLRKVKATHNKEPKGGIYISCLARGPNLFGPAGEEVAIIRDELGDFPFVGFFANGEISHDRLYGYTGVITLFF